jgi:CRP-like cAMP-binding protein
MRAFRNRFLRSLSDEDLAALEPLLTPVEFNTGDYVFQAGDPIHEFVVIDSGLVSIIQPLRNGGVYEIIAIGANTGLVGAHTLMSVPESVFDYCVRIPVTGWRLPREALWQARQQSSALQRRLQAYTQAVILAATHRAVCQQQHALEQRIGRCLLTTRDALGTNHLPLSQAAIATMSGCSRQSVSDYIRARPRMLARTRSVEILDPAALTAESCECYVVIRDLFDRIFD